MLRSLLSLNCWQTHWLYSFQHFPGWLHELHGWSSILALCEVRQRLMLTTQNQLKIFALAKCHWVNKYKGRVRLKQVPDVVESEAVSFCL